MRLPASVRFPFGYVVRIRQVTASEMAEEYDDAQPCDVPDGLWDHERRLIFVLKTLPPRRKRYILGHELGHAWLDWTHHCMIENQAKP